MRVENTIRIAAPRELVWAVTTDIERWPEWTPTVRRVVRLDTGSFGRGSVARISQPLQPVSDWTVTEFEEGRRFVWATRRPGLHMAGTHELREEGSGTVGVLRLEATGALAILLGPVLRVPVARALAAENEGLRERCEKLVREPGSLPGGSGA